MRIMGGHSLLGAMAAACGFTRGRSSDNGLQVTKAKQLRPIGDRPVDTFNGDLAWVRGPKVGKGSRRQRKEANRKRCLTELR